MMSFFLSLKMIYQDKEKMKPFFLSLKHYNMACGLFQPLLQTKRVKNRSEFQCVSLLIY